MDEQTNVSANMRKRSRSPHNCSQLSGCSYTLRAKNHYVCNTTGQVHVCDADCTERYVNRDSTATCKISGKCFEQMHQEHPFGRVEQLVDVTTYVPMRQKKTSRTRNPFKQEHTEQYLNQAKCILNELFYSKQRIEIDARKQDQLKKNVNRRVQKYIKGCKKHHKKVSRGDIETILRTEHTHMGRRVAILTNNPDQVAKYAEKIVHLWFSMSKTPYAEKHKSHMHFKDHILGTMYIMQYGFGMDNTMILQKDDFLYQQLPPIHDMKHYRFDLHKKSITIGKNAIVNCIRSKPSLFMTPTIQNKCE